MLRYLSLFIAVVTLSACCGDWGGCNILENPSGGLLGGLFNIQWVGEERLVSQINTGEVSRAILIYGEKLRYDKHFCLEDSVIYYDEYINRIRLDFSSMDNIYLWDARKALVDTVEEFLLRMNQNRQIQPYLARPPMSAMDLEVYITFPSFYNKYVDLQTVGLITLRKGIATYFAYDALDCYTECWHRRTEYYFQSRDFVQFKREGELLYEPEETFHKSALEKERYFPLDGENGTYQNVNFPPKRSSHPTPTHKSTHSNMPSPPHLPSHRSINFSQ